MSAAKQLRLEMVAGLTERGELSPAWRPAMEAVARNRFIPNVVWRLDESVDGPDLLPLRREDDPDGWLAMAYANAPVNTQVDDGHPDVEGRGREVTSSASQPAVVAQMLTALAAEPGMRVLEIGTGTGWNTALLAYRLGAENVVSIEVDPAMAAHARERLAATGYATTAVVTGDGALGYPEEAPYHRVLATVAARQVPYAWVAQTRPGGTVLLPWGSDWYPSALLRLTVGDAGLAHGRIVGSANFMALRSQRLRRWGVADVLSSSEQDMVSSTTDVHPWYVAAQPDAAMAIGLRVPACEQFYRDDGERGCRLNLVDQVSRSWARVRLSDAPPYPVEQCGPRKLWDEVVDAYRWWCEAGEPPVGAWLVTVDQDGQRVELRP